MDDGRVTLNAGGRVFETTALTLKTSGAGYFEALLGETGARLPGSKKRARVSEDGADAPGHREIFIDRDPDVFADVLRFMRTSRLPAAAADRIAAIFAATGLPTEVKLNAAQTKRLFAAMKLDKKVSGGEIKFVLAESIGRVKIGQSVPDAAVRRALRKS